MIDQRVFSVVSTTNIARDSLATMRPTLSFGTEATRAPYDLTLHFGRMPHGALGCLGNALISLCRDIRAVSGILDAIHHHDADASAIQ